MFPVVLSANVLILNLMIGVQISMTVKVFDIYLLLTILEYQCITIYLA